MPMGDEMAAGFGARAAIFASILLCACGRGGGGAGTDAGPGGTRDAGAGSGGGRFPPQILAFSPTAGAVGTSVLIQGLLFGDTAAQNTVRFNGVAAQVQSATPTDIVALVPAGATTGPIAVTTAGGTGRSARPFTVLADTTTPGVAWTTRLAGPRGSVEGLAWNGNLLVTVGDSIQTSKDVVRWEERMALVNLGDVAWDGHMFTAVGGSLLTYSSQTGLAWTRSGAPAGDLSAVAGSGTVWVAVGRAGTIRTSMDGSSWASASSPTTKHLRDVAWTGSQFVIVGGEGTVLTSPDGATWTVRPSGTADDFSAVGATSSLIVTTTSPSSNSPSLILTSADGVTWTERARGLPAGNSIIHAAGRWVVAGNTRVITSTDGVSWSVSASDLPILGAVVHTGDQYVALGRGGGSATSLYTSPDAQQWALRSSGQRLTRVARSSADGRLVAIGPSEVSLASTDQGATWQFGALKDPAGGLFLDVTWFPPASAFVALASEGANQRIHTSTDGLTWTRGGHVPYSGALGASPGLLVNVGANVAGRGLATSPDGVTWTPRTLPTSQSLEDVFWTGSQFVAVGSSGSIITSPDGVEWTARTSGSTAALSGVAASPIMTVVVGASGTILTSLDGATWESRASGTRTGLRAVAWTGKEFVAVGSGGTAVRSVDGASWTVQPTPFSDVLFGSEAFTLNDAVWTGPGARLVVVGARGLVATSP
jgi:hypothetical protein